jgi:antitoxin (DNA-binding transcriptional repressor) of toxin-antitoxin stability system
METQKVGIREFRDKLATFVLESEVPVAITRHGETVGHYVPVRRKRPTAEQIEAFRVAREAFQKQLEAAGISEDEYLEDFERWRKSDRAETTKKKVA